MKSLECASVAELNEDFPIESLGSQNISTFLCLCLSLSLPVFSLSPCLSSLSSLLGSQLALFLRPFDLSERVWSFKVLLFPLSGAPLFLPSGLGFQSGGSPVLWMGGSGGGGQVSMRWWDWRWGWRGNGCVMLSASVRRVPDWSQFPPKPPVPTSLSPLWPQV